MVGLRDRALDRAMIAAERVGRAIHDDLRRINLTIAAHTRIGALARRMRGIGERVSPAEIIPVIDRNAQCDERRVVGQLTYQSVGRWAGRTALTGEQFENRARLGGARACKTCDHKARDEECRDEECRRNAAICHYNLRLMAFATVSVTGVCSARSPHPPLTSR